MRSLRFRHAVALAALSLLVACHRHKKPATPDDVAAPVAPVATTGAGTSSMSGGSSSSLAGGAGASARASGGSNGSTGGSAPRPAIAVAPTPPAPPPPPDKPKVDVGAIVGIGVGVVAAAVPPPQPISVGESHRTQDSQLCYAHDCNGASTGRKCFGDKGSYCKSLCGEHNCAAEMACKAECR